ncbi:MAG TPA: stage II sporulation protein R [Paenibacillus sp.]|jgi:stage II sporulation protein R
MMSSDARRVLVKNTAIIFSILFLLVMSWESQRTDASVVEGLIPQESIRLRILANSDRTGDQIVKKEIRDVIVEQMNGWVQELEDPQSLEQARAVIKQHLSELNTLVGKELANRGIHYNYQVELGMVAFPTKLYGGTVYPAGEYEALRITLGEGKGQNWWCVLFPPLCFIDAGTGDAVATSTASTVEAKGEGGNVEETSESPEVHFFLWDMILGLIEWIKELFV